MTSMPVVSPAPGELEFVRQFVNSLDVEAGTDRFAGPLAFRTWAADWGIDATVDEGELAEVLELREALRDALMANHDREPLPARTVDALNAASERARSVVRFRPEESIVISEESGVEAILGRIVAAVAGAMAESTWHRLKACAADDCRWGFYDTSRSRTGQWCSMSICGNRAKQARYRSSHKTPPASLLRPRD